MSLKHNQDDIALVILSIETLFQCNSMREKHGEVKKNVIDTFILLNIIFTEHPQTVPLVGGSGVSFKNSLIQPGLCSEFHDSPG